MGEMAAERILRGKQQDNRTEQEQYAHSRATEKLNKSIEAASKRKKKQEFVADYTRRLEQSRVEAKGLAEEDRTYKRQIAQTQHSHEVTVKAANRIDQAGRLTYSTQMSEGQTMKGRQFKARTQRKGGTLSTTARAAIE